MKPCKRCLRLSTVSDSNSSMMAGLRVSKDNQNIIKANSIKIILMKLGQADGTIKFEMMTNLTLVKSSL